ncbi:MAG: HD domain-containing protein [Fimbriimonadaceae bacterium]
MSAGQDDRTPKLAVRREELLHGLRERPSGLAWCEGHSDLVDEVVREVYAGLFSQVQELPRLAIVATGGYGRRELAPWSDVDLTLVPLDESQPELDRTIKLLYKGLHDSLVDGLGLKLSYALRFASDCAGLDPKTRSGLLDSRVVVGTTEAHDSLMQAFWATFPVAAFVIAKIQEQSASWSKTNDTPYATQPHLKLGAGGLRCFQSANWIGAAVGERTSRPSHAYDEVLKYRNLLHLVTMKCHDQMTHERRAEVAEILGRSGRDVGSTLAGELATLHRDYLSCLDRLHESRFPLAKHVDAVRGEARIDARASAGQAAIGIACATRLGLRVGDIKADPTGAVDAPEAMSALASGEKTVRNLDKSGVLDVLLPELTACRTLLPEDGSHDFTVYEHTLRVLRNLDSITPDTFLGSVMGDLRDRAPLYLAALLHDVGRQVGEARHAEIGAEMAAAVCDRWGVYESTKETVCWLVREHLAFDRALRLRDVMHPETAIEFAQKVGTPERLAMLGLLTWADVNAVNAQAWTAAQDTFLRELYARTMAVLTAEEAPTTDYAVYRRRMVQLSKGHDVPQAEFEAFLDSMPAYYLISTDPALARAHFWLVQEAKQGEVAVELQDTAEMGGTDVTVCCRDAPGLLSRILAVLYAFELSIIAIRASTTDDAVPVALDTITVSFGSRPIPRSTGARFAETMAKVLKGGADADDVLKAAKKDPDRPQQVMTYQFIQGSPGIIEVQAPRGRGLAYRLARQLSAAGINILGARVGQWAGSGAAAFYVSGRNGAPLDASLVAEALKGQKV